MGVVFEAEQISLSRKVALKILPFAAVLDHKQITRFKNEARAAGSLDHPNIVPVYSVGEERGVYYYAMALVEGQSLAEVIAEMRLDEKTVGANSDGHANPTRVEPQVPQAFAVETQKIPKAGISTQRSSQKSGYFHTVARLGIQAAEALQFACENGVLHRDIKPANLLLDTKGKLWVTDFGLARLEAEAGMTMTGDLLGTLRYMSPEQAFGKRTILDQRSDIYSLGITLYELIALRPPFDVENRKNS